MWVDCVVCHPCTGGKKLSGVTCLVSPHLPGDLSSHCYTFYQLQATLITSNIWRIQHLSKWITHISALYSILLNWELNYLWNVKCLHVKYNISMCRSDDTAQGGGCLTSSTWIYILVPTWTSSSWMTESPEDWTFFLTEPEEGQLTTWCLKGCVLSHPLPQNCWWPRVSGLLLTYYSMFHNFENDTHRSMGDILHIENIVQTDILSFRNTYLCHCTA